MKEDQSDFLIVFEFPSFDFDGRMYLSTVKIMALDIQLYC